jgi:hypothetical protein
LADHPLLDHHVLRLGSAVGAYGLAARRRAGFDETIRWGRQQGRFDTPLKCNSAYSAIS